MQRVGVARTLLFEPIGLKNEEFPTQIMSIVNGFLGAMLGQKQKPKPIVVSIPAKPPLEVPAAKVTGFYRKGDMIGGKYKILGILGKGGFGVVYLALNLQTTAVCALKTFRDELLANTQARDAFKKEALLWLNLDAHPSILAAQLVTEVYGRLFVQMEYVACDDLKRVTLADHLATARGSLENKQVLKWAVQFCTGMEHARAHGIACHRDIKPGNIIIARGGVLKISDFGLAAAVEAASLEKDSAGGSAITNYTEGGFGMSLMRVGGQARCGTPGYMAPEVYRGEGADVRSDIYSFGLVMWQMAAGSRNPPFVTPHPVNLDAYMRETYEHQMAGHLPRVEAMLYPAIERCLRPQPRERWKSFQELREALEPILERLTGIRTEAPQVEGDGPEFWMRKGISLLGLHQFQEALPYFERVLAVDSRSARAWSCKGISLIKLKQYDEGIKCCDEALAIDPQSVETLVNKGFALDEQGRRQEAIACYDQGLAIHPKFTSAWIKKGRALHSLRQHLAALVCYDRALEVDPRNDVAWSNKGFCLAAMGQQVDAIGCLNQALIINPQDRLAWMKMGIVFEDLNRIEEAMRCYDRMLTFFPNSVEAWNNKGRLMARLRRREEAISCMEKAIAIDPRCAMAWFNKGLYQDELGRHREAAESYRRFVNMAPAGDVEMVTHARKRLSKWTVEGAIT